MADVPRAEGAEGAEALGRRLVRRRSQFLADQAEAFGDVKDDLAALLADVATERARVVLAIEILILDAHRCVTPAGSTDHILSLEHRQQRSQRARRVRPETDHQECLANGFCAGFHGPVSLKCCVLSS